MARQRIGNYIILLSMLPGCSLVAMQQDGEPDDDEKEYAEFTAQISPTTSSSVRTSRQLSSSQKKSVSDAQRTQLAQPAAQVGSGGVIDTVYDLARRARNRFITGQAAAVLQSLEDGTFDATYPGVDGVNIRNRAIEELVKANNIPDLHKLAGFYQRKAIIPTDWERNIAGNVFLQEHQKKSSALSAMLKERNEARTKLLAEWDEETQKLLVQHQEEIATVQTALDLFNPPVTESE